VSNDVCALPVGVDSMLDRLLLTCLTVCCLPALKSSMHMYTETISFQMYICPQPHTFNCGAALQMACAAARPPGPPPIIATSTEWDDALCMWAVGKWLADGFGLKCGCTISAHGSQHKFLIIMLKPHRSVDASCLDGLMRVSTLFM